MFEQTDFKLRAFDELLSFKLKIVCTFKKPPASAHIIRLGLKVVSSLQTVRLLHSLIEWVCVVHFEPITSR